MDIFLKLRSSLYLPTNSSEQLDTSSSSRKWSDASKRQEAYVTGHKSKSRFLLCGDKGGELFLHPY